MADNSSSGIFRIFIFALFALLPLIYVESLVDFTLLPRQLFVSAMVLVGVLLLLFAKFKTVPHFPLAWAALGGLVLLSLASSSQAINAVESWATASRYGLSFSYLGLILLLFQTEKLSKEILIKAAIVFGGITALASLVSIFRAIGSGDFADDIYTVKATFSHKNLLSSALMLSLPFAGMGAVLFKKVWQKTSLVLLFLIVAEIFVLRTRGVWLGVFGASAISFIVFFLSKKRKQLEVKFPVKTVGISLGLAVVLLVAMFSVEGIRQNIGDSSTLQNRQLYWKASLQMAQEKPLLGVGAGNWKIHFPKYGLSGLDDSVRQGITHIQRPHNDFLWILSESGILALLCFLAVFFSSFLSLSRKLKTAQTKSEWALSIFTIFGLCAYLIFSLTDFPLERTPHNVLIFSLVALAVSHGGDKKSLKIAAKPLLVLLGGFALFSLIVSYFRMQGEQFSKEVQEANAARNAQKIIPAAESAMNAFYNMDPFANPLPYYSSLGKLVLKNQAGAWEDAQWALDLHPNNIVVLGQAAQVKMVQKKPDEALPFYEKAVKISPTFATGQLGIAEIYLQKKEFAKAQFALNQLQPDIQNQRYLNLLSRTLPSLVATKNQHGRYQKMIRTIEKRDPKNPQQFVQFYLEARNIPLR